ncbi:hypothetical protein GCM10010964_35540 [Caldovatus sediminis]|uniref:TolA-binding protein n=1 Tax=Caldovatus sediminis TaxID=2041189 RepID=A0A8J2ZDL5_9PROT|nr:tetratricopeptide repeat protein [Caldovatus sediminis]GGG45034.1 hypothetical protein GCM10010964_35540 [Caldovatus sediminis]
MRFTLPVLALTAAMAGAGIVPPSGPALAQIESREGIALQNQILQLRAELEQLRRGGSALAAPSLPPPGRGAGVALPGGQVELLNQLLDRVGRLEEEVRSLRGRVEEAEFRSRQLAAEVEKLQGDMDFRLRQLEGGGAARPPGAGAAAPARPAAPPPAAAPAPAAAGVPRPPERALAEGQQALARRDFAAAEAAAREVLANRGGGPRGQDALLLLGEALLGKGDAQNAAIAFDDAYRRNRQSARAPEALLGLATAFNAFNARREACATLDQLRSEFPRLPQPLATRAQEQRQRAGCR